MPQVLDLFCGVGGAGEGYHRAGFDVWGIDIEDQPNYPHSFSKFDAIVYLESMVEMIRTGWPTSYDLIHASPPCHAHSTLTKGTNYGREYPDLIAETRKLLDRTGLPYVIENVPTAPIRKDLMLCGEMFGLNVIRHRWFEFGNGLEVPQHDHYPHRGRVQGYRHGEKFEGPYVAVYGNGGGKGSVEQWQDAMEIHWTDKKSEIAQAIPPAYTEYIGLWALDKSGLWAAEAV